MICLDPHRMQELLDRRLTIDVRPSESRIRQRTALLPDRERLIVELVFLHQVPVRRVALAVGLPAGTVSRLARRLYRRLHLPMADALLASGPGLTPDQRQLAIDYFLRRRPVPQLAAERCVPAREIRLLLQFIRGWQRGLSAAARAG